MGHVFNARISAADNGNAKQLWPGGHERRDLVTESAAFIRGIKDIHERPPFVMAIEIRCHPGRDNTIIILEPIPVYPNDILGKNDLFDFANDMSDLFSRGKMRERIFDHLRRKPSTGHIRIKRFITDHGLVIDERNCQRRVPAQAPGYALPDKSRTDHDHIFHECSLNSKIIPTLFLVVIAPALTFSFYEVKRLREEARQRRDDAAISALRLQFDRLTVLSNVEGLRFARNDDALKLPVTGPNPIIKN
jgi:hypothetical protein